MNLPKHLFSLLNPSWHRGCNRSSANGSARLAQKRESSERFNAGVNGDARFGTVTFDIQGIGERLMMSADGATGIIGGLRGHKLAGFKYSGRCDMWVTGHLDQKVRLIAGRKQN
ncbi:MAG: hypothetical protein OEZ23_05915 [Gammaproteobacteria bacterium]|nr:hypothetical protein [Gammaproteobacteria bacterium]